MSDVAWMPIAEWRHTDEQTRRTYRGVLVPAFVIEVPSQTDNLPEVEDKCREWIAGGVQEAWLIDPIERKIQIFKQNSRTVDTVSNPTAVGPSFMPGLILNLQLIWDS